MAKSILAVDDSASIRQMVTFTLKGAGFETEEAADGKAALDKYVFLRDAYLQRPLTADERGMLADWPADVVGLAYNAGPDDTLATEGQRLRSQADPTARGFDTALPVFNLGVIVCRAAAYRRWHDAYASLLPRLEGLFRHHAHQQWGLCAALPAAGLRAAVPPPSVHIHGHYPPPPGVSVARERGRVTANGAVVLFRHYL